MSTVFTKIIQREIPAHIVAENEWAIAFMDIRLLQHGHVLVVPKKEVDKLFHLPQEVFLKVWAFAQDVAQGIESVVPCNRIGVTVYGLEVPHAHIHLIPIQQEGDMDFRKPMTNVAQDDLAALAAKIKAAIH